MTYVRKMLIHGDGLLLDFFINRDSFSFSFFSFLKPILISEIKIPEEFDGTAVSIFPIEPTAHNSS